jgi:hypothetical protein
MLFAPMLAAKRETFLQMIVLATRPIQGIITVYVMKQMMMALEIGDQKMFGWYLMAFGLYVVGDKVFQYVTRDRTRVRMGSLYNQIITTQYLPKFFSLENTYTEKQ